jgi:hypothetical protein
MILRSYNVTPYDNPATILLVLFGLVVLAGCIFGAGWAPTLATILWRASILMALIAVGFIYLVTPTMDAFMGAGRL